MAYLPVELQLIILKYVFYSTYSSDPRRLRSCFTDFLRIQDNFPLATAFLYARTRAPKLHVPLKLQGHQHCIQWIDEPLVLRAALAAALPAWRGALCGIPALWTHIAVPVDDETWGPAVLDAVKEALEFSKAEPLTIMVTSVAPGTQEGRPRQTENEEAERVAQLMALLTPHIARWRSLRVYTLHSAALPVPTVHFAGQAPLLTDLRLCAALDAPVPVATVAPAMSSEIHAFVVPHLQHVVLDTHVFRTAFLHSPHALPMVRLLALWGPGFLLKRWGPETLAIGPPEISVHALLVCAAQLPSLEILWLGGAALSVGDDGQRMGNEEGASTALRNAMHIHCQSLQVEVLADVLELVHQGWDTIEEPGNWHARHNLQIVDCALPCSPQLENYDEIGLENIAMNEDLASFLRNASQCSRLSVDQYGSFPLEKFGVVENVTSESEFTLPGTDNGLISVNHDWLLPRLKDLSLYECAGVEAETTEGLRVARQRASLAGEDVDELTSIRLNGHFIYVAEDDE